MNTQDQAIAIAQEHRQMWEGCTSRPFTTREAEFATLVRNAALEEAAKKCDALYFNLNAGPDTCAQAIRAMKEPTT